MTLRRMILVAMAITIVFVQEQVLMIVPNVQLTVALLVIYARVFSLKENITLIFVYVLLDSLYMGTLNPFYMTPMLIGWSLIPISLHIFLPKTNNEKTLALFGLVFSFVYGWVFIPFHMIQTGIHTWWPYLLADIPFQIVMGVSSYISILWVYQPLVRLIRQEMEKLEHQFKPIYHPHEK